jgi:mRNA interferase RelE/StbE
VTAEGDDRYTVRITAPASRAIGRLETKLVDAVLAFIDGPLADNPMRVTKPLTGELEGKRSGYVGIAFRVLVEVDENQRTVWVLRVAHRADVYRP